MKTFLQITQSIFNNHVLPIKHDGAIERSGNYNLPVFILLFICCILIIYVYLRYYKKIWQVFSSVVSYSASQQIQREGHSFFRSFSISLFLIYMICGGVFFTDLIHHFQLLTHISSDIILIISIVTIGVLLLTRKLLNNLLGTLTKEKTATEDCFFQYSFNLYAGALVLLIFCLLLHYSNLPAAYLFYVIISALGLLFITRMLKTLAFGYSVYGFSLFHLVLYLCAVEIIPLAIFIKIIVNG